MKPEEQRIAIAKACGWTPFTPCAAVLDIRDCDEPSDEPPDYPNDLNAMHEAEKILSTTQKLDYVRTLVNLMGGWMMMLEFSTTFATAAQRAEVFLKTLNLWKD